MVLEAHVIPRVYLGAICAMCLLFWLNSASLRLRVSALRNKRKERRDAEGPRRSRPRAPPSCTCSLNQREAYSLTPSRSRPQMHRSTGPTHEAPLHHIPNQFDSRGLRRRRHGPTPPLQQLNSVNILYPQPFSRPYTISQNCLCGPLRLRALCVKDKRRERKDAEGAERSTALADYAPTTL